MSKEKVIRDINLLEVLEEDFTGSIVCKKLKIPLGKKFEGYVIAEELYVLGTFDGHAEVKTFYASETSVLDGTVIAETINNRSLDQNIRTSTRLRKMMRPFFSTEENLASIMNVAVQSAMDQVGVSSAPKNPVAETGPELSKIITDDKYVERNEFLDETAALFADIDSSSDLEQQDEVVEEKENNSELVSANTHIEKSSLMRPLTF